ncbi:MAG: hypothetical protein O2960_10100 [Verrucomicrobia bacterium]|nr:hypothetical protein [Verrucomicrobiota bacterium]
MRLRHSIFWAVFTAIISNFSSALNAQNLRDGLEVYWSFDEGAANTANDSSGHDRKAVPAEKLFPGAVIDWSGGRFGGSVKFDRSYMLHSPFEYYGIGGSEPRTVSFWIKTSWNAANSSSLGALVGWGVNATQQRIHVKLNGSTDANGKVLQHIRTENQGGNNFGNSILLNDGVWHHIISVFDPNVDSNGDGVFAAVGDFDHYVDGVLETKGGTAATPVNTNINPDEGAVPLAVGGGYFPNIDAARTSEARIDEFRLYNRALSVAEILALSKGTDVDGPPTIEFSSEIEGAELVDNSVPIEFSVVPQGAATVSASKVSLVLNSRDVTSDTEITGSEMKLTGIYKGLQKNIVYLGKISATDSLNRTYSFEFNFDTISLDNFAIEAEDFNFGGGTSFDNPVPCDIGGGGVDRCFRDRVSNLGVDAQDSKDDDRPTEAEADYQLYLANGYRFGPGVFRDEFVDTWVSGDSLRDRFIQAGAGMLDYDVERISMGEWMNYTRTLEPGTYQILARARGRGAQTLSLGLVANPASANQTVTPLGSFKILPTGSSYRFTPLTDDQGRTAIMDLGGRQTIRLTAVDANGSVDLNYFMFVPATAVQEPTESRLQYALEGGQINITWQGTGGVLQRASAVIGPWENVSTSANRFSKSPNSAAEFFRLVSP